ncbi:polysaccharide biosynthesis protein [Citreimonas salinaria]|uniref:NDP-sugar epimerase, includes UDP-GlcNAc-inverting 4,6-dehydratase FlaA1 and capsular polysaccharide biosynthesis protein EpsC n=1 Tax=Citreimonas salinaria TaxID=321339 RepID=A0A1H3FJ46_9RHOB|nr:nucleoside-diphosphate sugar epimerase/dehydratase [Citreimonas salinaria]SDX91082.1 NDP-sugar epimerase, includes UDP-GlcNAc-inverting 4,6-dehydratase FlaA1 and capsular polysaccharide biosynthesis protein EpsC [Citreimonas salinaria]
MIYRLVTAMTRRQKQCVFAAMDALVAAAAVLVSVVLVASLRGEAAALAQAMPLALCAACAAVVLSWSLGLPQVKLNAFEMRSAARAALLALFVTVAGIGLDAILNTGFAIGQHVIAGLILLILTVSWRLLLLNVTNEIYRRGKPRMRVLIYGAGQTGRQLAAALRHDEKIYPVAFLDDNPTLQSLVIGGLRVHAPSAVEDLVRKKTIDRIVLAMPSINTPALARIAHGLRNVGAEVHALPSFAQMVGQSGVPMRAAPVPLDSLLGRSRLESDLPLVGDTYSGRRVMVTGAGGSIGSELCRQILACNPHCLVLVDQSELALYTIEKELTELDAAPEIVPVLGSILDGPTMTNVMRRHRIDVVLHAAAYKHLPLVEANPIAGLENNVLGTRVLAEAARETEVERFILISSDKAVRPTNVMGASKRLAELVVQDLATRSGRTRFSMVRFGNVLGSSGSVVPLFEEQIARGGPVTLTHAEVTRYFMTIAEAARLVLLAGSFARGGDVFVLDMGAAVPIRRLARQMIEGAGFSVRDADNPDGDIEIRITGLRQGEKLHEELLIAPDMLTTPHAKIMRAQESYLSEFETANALRALRDAIDDRDEAAARAVIGRWVEGVAAPAHGGAASL